MSKFLELRAAFSAARTAYANGTDPTVCLPNVRALQLSTFIADLDLSSVREAAENYKQALAAVKAANEVFHEAMDESLVSPDHVRTYERAHGDLDVMAERFAAAVHALDLF